LGVPLGFPVSAFVCTFIYQYTPYGRIYASPELISGVNHLSQRQLGKVRVAALDGGGGFSMCVCCKSARHVTALAVRGDQWPNPLPQTVEKYPAASSPCGSVARLQYRAPRVWFAPLIFARQAFEVRVQIGLCRFAF
jgi:hypothetical protein